MKKIYTLLIGIIFSTPFLYTQTVVPGSPPQGFSYKATIIKANGAIVASKTISLRISILQTSTTGSVLYSDVFYPKTSEYGQIDVVIGGNSGLPNISWAEGPFFLKTEFDEKGGTAFVTISITQLLSVPYALYSGSSTNTTKVYYNELIGAPDLALVATTGNYDHLYNKPYIFNGNWNFLTDKPNSLTGYGITDAMSSLHPANSITSTNITNWNTASGWGNHATAGYVTVEGVQTLTNKTFSSPVINSPTGLSKADVGLGNVDNIPDLLKPISASTQAALELKENALTFNTPLVRVTNMISLPPATSSSNGFFSSIDKVKLDGLQNADGSETKVISGTNVTVTGYGTAENPYSINSTVTIINGNNKGDMQYWDGSKWILIPVGSNGQVLTISNGIPTWGSVSSACAVPTLTTKPITNIATSGALSGGNIQSDGGCPVTTRGICYGTSINPTISGNKTVDDMGTGEFISTMTGLIPNTLYYVRAYATNATGTTYGDQGSFTTLQIPPIGFNTNSTYGTMSDVDGNDYKTIQIGNQIWMAENLRVTKYNDGITSIPVVEDKGSWASTKTPAFCWYNNNQASFGNTYGALYNWYVANTENLCPIGWHIPTDAEWTTLSNYLGSNAGGKLKETGTNHWNVPNDEATNETGFTALPGGWRDMDADFHGDGTFDYLGSQGNWMSSTSTNALGFFNRFLFADGGVILRGVVSKQSATSVRCVKDNNGADIDADNDGYTEAQGDCNDNDPNIHAGAAEIPGNDIDEDCNGYVSCFMDGDNDGYGSATASKDCYAATNGHSLITNACGSSNLDGFDDTSDDCWDANATVFPSAPDDECDYLDRNCDGYDCWKDNDVDGVHDEEDNCIFKFNPNQEDIDKDGIGDACDDEYTPVNGEPISDRDGNTYSTVIIGTQTWMRQNLRVTKFNDGTPIPFVTNAESWGSFAPAYCWAFEPELKEDYGALYNYHVVSNANVCPTGWHVSTDIDWQNLASFCAQYFRVGPMILIGGLLKEVGTIPYHWLSPNNGATDALGFRALPGGKRDVFGNFEYMYVRGFWWVKEMTAPNEVMSLYLSSENDQLFTDYQDRRDGCSVRCVKDN